MLYSVEISFLANYEFRFSEILMKRLLLILVSSSLILSVFVNAKEIAAIPEWDLRIDEVDIQVFTRFSEVEIEGDKKNQLEYRVITTSTRTPEILASVINNIGVHSDFFGSATAEYIKNIEGIEGVYVYYYFDNPWPIPNLDLVRHISQVATLENGDIQIKHTGSPGAYGYKGVKRLEISDMIYTLSVKGDESTVLKMEGRFIPNGAPLILVKAWLPDGPKEIALKIIQHAEEISPELSAQ